MTLTEAFPGLAGFPAERVQRWFDMIARCAPHVAAEPLIVGSALLGLLQLNNVDVTWMIKLIELDQLMASQRAH